MFSAINFTLSFDVLAEEHKPQSWQDSPWDKKLND